MASFYEAVDAGKACPYCGKLTELTDSSEVYPTNYGKIYICRDCFAWVNCHTGTTIALGRVAKKELRQNKKTAHHYFDALWHRKMERDKCSKSVARSSAYAWLAKVMNLPPERAHIGMMDDQQCTQLVEICKKYV